MARLTKLITSHVQAFEKQLTHLLEKEDWHQPQPEFAFEVKTDLTDIDTLKIGLPEDTTKRLSILFSRLNPYFDSGLLFSLKKVDSQFKKEEWSMIAGFHQGVYHPLDLVRKNNSLVLPYLQEYEIKKCSSEKILRQLDLSQFASSDTQAIILKPQHPFLYILFTSLPEPWLKRQVSTVVEEIQFILADYL